MEKSNQKQTESKMKEQKIWDLKGKLLCNVNFDYYPFTGQNILNVHSLISFKRIILHFTLKCLNSILKGINKKSTRRNDHEFLVETLEILVQFGDYPYRLKSLSE